LGVDTSFESLAYFSGQIVVNDVFEINVIKLVGPWMKNLETLVIHVLLSESKDIVFQKFEVGLISLAGIAQVVLGDFLGSVSQEGTNGLDAGGTLKILRAKKLVKMLLRRVRSRGCLNLEHLKDSHEDLLEAL